MRTMCVLVVVAMLTACQQTGIAPDPMASPAVTASPSADTSAAPSAAADPMPAGTTVGSLEGEWRVAGIDGADFNESYGLALRGSARELWWEPRCAGVARSYTIDGAKIAFAPYIGAPGPGEMPPPVCAIGLPPRLSDVTRALDAATNVERTESNGILISGGGRSVLLFSQ